MLEHDVGIDHRRAALVGATLPGDLRDSRLALEHQRTQVLELEPPQIVEPVRRKRTSLFHLPPSSHLGRTRPTRATERQPDASRARR